jgi:N,N'-diacetylchitobiose phosphorylase
MQYGYFDDANKEYVITKPDTPRPWSNYLGSTEFGSVITNNAGGYCFYKSAAQGRFMRARLNTIPMDQPGRYIYLHDHDNKDYWSASWQPVGKPLDKYKSECRHGTAYTDISSTYTNIKTDVRYFVPMGKLFEVWKVTVTNNSKKKRKLSLFTYVEYGCNWNAFDDLVNLQFTQYIITMGCKDGIIDHGTNVNIPPKPEDFQFKDQGRHTFIGIAGAKVAGFDTDRDAFIGTHHSYCNPIMVEKGKCSGSLAYGDNGCGVLQVKISLKPGESKELAVVMGIGAAEIEGKAAVAEYSDMKHLADEFNKVKEYWQSKIEGMTVKTPDKEFDGMFNNWNPYNNLITFMWSRAASLVYNGERDGLGYRDTVQDCVGIAHNVPELVKPRLEMMITGQAHTGGAMSVIKPFAHKPGSEATPQHYRSDDCQWLFNAVTTYVKETGDLSFFDKVLPYCDKGQDTVLGHLRKALEFNIARSGKRGLPCGLDADWNDCIRLGQDGETVFVAFQHRYGLKTYIEICEMLNRPAEVGWAKPILAKLDEDLEKNAWDGEWYTRAFKADGYKFGSKECEEGKIFLNPQTWAILSGHTKGEQAGTIMKSVKKYLATPYGIAICDPPYTVKTDWKVMLACLFNRSMKENGGIFNHIQGWAVMAEAMLGHGEQAYEYYRSYLPAAFNKKAEIRQIEPYVYSQSTHGKCSPRYGASRVPWLSGASTWAYYSAAQYILGVRPEYNGITIDPAISKKWKSFSITRRFRGKMLNISVDNTAAVQKGVKEITVNGERMIGSFIPVGKLKDKNEIMVKMG